MIEAESSVYFQLARQNPWCRCRPEGDKTRQLRIYPKPGQVIFFESYSHVNTG
jgi:hypothetical protein